MNVDVEQTHDVVPEVQHEKDVSVNNTDEMLAAYKECTEEDKLQIKQTALQLTQKSLVNLGIFYNENMVNCRRQPVAGNNYLTTIHVNDQYCILHFYKDL